MQKGKKDAIVRNCEGMLREKLLYQNPGIHSYAATPLHMWSPNKDCSKLEKEYKDIPCSLVSDTGKTVQLNMSQCQVL